MNLKERATTHPDFITLTRKLDEDLAARYGDAQTKYDTHNTVQSIPTAMVGYENGIPVACGCFKKISRGRVEIKRMYVAPDFRGEGMAQTLLTALEYWAARLGYEKVRLETGKGQPEAIGLYKKAGYSVIPNYGPYKKLENSVCMEKTI